MAGRCQLSFFCHGTRGTQRRGVPTQGTLVGTPLTLVPRDARMVPVLWAGSPACPLVAHESASFVSTYGTSRHTHGYARVSAQRAWTSQDDKMHGTRYPTEVDDVPPPVRPSGVPLSPGCYRPTDGDRQRYTTLVRGRVASLLRDEARCAERQWRLGACLHAGEWKQVKKTKNLTFYRRFERGRSRRELALEEELPEMQRAVERGYTSMICDGFVDGTIEDVLYGMTASSQDDLRTGFAYQNPPRDCVWLGTIARPTCDAPFTTVDLIWVLPKLSPVLELVDVCYLKATGIAKDDQGQRYGYLVLHSVHLGQCPSFGAHGISRAKMYFAALFREPHAGTLKVSVRGILDLSKKVRLLQRLVSASTTSLMVGLFNGVKIGRAKKLTLLAWRQRARGAPAGHARRPVTCATCHRRASRLGRATGFGTRFVTCYVCRDTVCTHCTRGVKQRVFLSTTHAWSPVDCCPACVHDAMTTIHACPDLFDVVAEVYRPGRGSPSTTTRAKPHLNDAIPTVSTEGTVSELNLEFDDEAFSAALSLPMLRRSSDEDEEHATSDERETGLRARTVRPWRHRLDVDDRDFIPASSAERLYHAMHMERRRLELNP